MMVSSFNPGARSWLHVLPIHLPPLRERREDILPLAEAFLTRFAEEEGRCFAGFDAEAVQSLAACPWPGNVRQLANVVRRLVVLGDGSGINAAMLPEVSASRRPVGVEASAPAAILPYWRQEKRIIEAALDAFGGNIARAAAALEINPSTIYRKREAWSERSLPET